MPKLYFFALLLALAGCAGSRSTTRLHVASGYCDPPLPYRYDPAFAPQPDFGAALTPALLAAAVPELAPATLARLQAHPRLAHGLGALVAERRGLPPCTASPSPSGQGPRAGFTSGRLVLLPPSARARSR